jgi:phage-related protein
VSEEIRPVRWVGSALRDLKGFPRSVQRDFGQALCAAQCGEAYPSVKALKGFGGASVLETVAPFDTDTYRAVYTVRLGSTIYVLHAFKKKADKGRETPRKDIELIKTRLEMARQDHRRRQDSWRRSETKLRLAAAMFSLISGLHTRIASS